MSVTATMIVAVLALAVRVSTEGERQKFTFFAPYLLLFIMIASSLGVQQPDVDGQVASIIYLASAFGFSLHNFQIPGRVHYVNAVVSGLMTGMALTSIGFWACRFGHVVIHSKFGFWTAQVAFVVCWGLVCLVVYLRQRSPRHAKDSGQIETTER